MQPLAVAILLALACAGPRVRASEMDEALHTLGIVADTPAKIEPEGPLRGYFRHVRAPADRRTMTVEFYNKHTGECKKYTVVGEREDEGVYVGQYDGVNHFTVLYQDDDSTIFHNRNTDEGGNVTNMILLAGKGQSLTQQQEKKLKKFAKKHGLPFASLQRVQETDDCPE
ncbi:lipocalin Cav p 3.0101-like [Perognathus longimembris pacificus]|uniref:lipocalin Cav p 3.0101-like n=1 Tax=Perognathus longimembris pacificus TaxID=214514 RepID=UPI002018C13D|nr:lipocalin Cav p 3.0101-like [Perognathus longimembris pacificus]